MKKTGLLIAVIVLLLLALGAVWLMNELDKDFENRTYTNTDIVRCIDEYIHSERNRSILKRRLCDGISFEALAEEYDLSVRQVKAIIYKEQEEIFAQL